MNAPRASEQRSIFTIHCSMGTKKIHENQNPMSVQDTLNIEHGLNLSCTKKNWPQNAEATAPLRQKVHAGLDPSPVPNATLQALVSQSKHAFASSAKTAQLHGRRAQSRIVELLPGQAGEAPHQGHNLNGMPADFHSVFVRKSAHSKGAISCTLKQVPQAKNCTIKS